jgi:2,3-bisphosphoglycerate-dependent phosphoglycerate mutase
MQLYFIRHAQSTNNALWLKPEADSETRRNPDPELTATGRQQTGNLAQFLRQGSPGGGQSTAEDGEGFGITHIYTSLMVRAVETAAEVAAELSLPLKAWPDLHEYGGIYEMDPDTQERVGKPGPGRAFFEGRYPDLQLPSSLNEQGWWNRPFESPEEAARRAARVLKIIRVRHSLDDDRVAFVSHGGFFKIFLCELLGTPWLQAGWISMANTAITRIDFHSDWFDVAYVNRTDFIPSVLYTP